MAEPLVSVKMITYNHAPFIAQAIEGVLRQKTSFPFELVIGEDCSTDGTRDIVFAYQKLYPEIIRVVTSEKNVGAFHNSKRAMAALSGTYIAFCEGDDYWHDPGKLQKQVDYMERHPECGLLFTDGDIYNEHAAKLRKAYNWGNGFRSPLNLSVEQLLVIGGNIAKITCTAMARRKLCERLIQADLRLYSGVYLMGDTQLWAELATVSVVSYLPESMATYRILEESASRSRNPARQCRFWISAAEMRLYLHAKHHLSDAVRKNAEKLWSRRSLQLAYHEKNVELAATAKARKPRLRWDEWIWYWGAKNGAVHVIFHTVTSGRDFVLRMGHRLRRKRLRYNESGKIIAK